MMQQQQKQKQQPIITMPTATDVLCGRGKSCNNHNGNIQFITIVKDHVQTYMNLSSRFEKTLLVRNLVHQLRNEIGVQFLKKSSTSSSFWYPLNEDESNTKVGHAIRDMIKTNRKKSNNNNNKSSQAIKKMKQQQQQTKSITNTATTTICYEPICCHSTENLIDHCITTRSMSLKTSDLLCECVGIKALSLLPHCTVYTKKSKNGLR
jgi:thiol:disulfide interchange protein